MRLRVRDCLDACRPRSCTLVVPLLLVRLGQVHGYINLEPAVDPEVLDVVVDARAFSSKEQQQQQQQPSALTLALGPPTSLVTEGGGHASLEADLSSAAVGDASITAFTLVFVLSVVLGMGCGVFGSWVTTEFITQKPEWGDHPDDTPSSSPSRARRSNASPRVGSWPPNASPRAGSWTGLLSFCFFWAWLQLLPYRGDCERLFLEVRHGSEDLFFRHVRIRPDGGLRKDGSADCLFNKSRVFQVAVTVVLSVFNIWVVFYNFCVSVFMLAHADDVNRARFVIVLDHHAAGSSQVLENLYLIIALIEITVVAAMFVYICWVLANYNLWCKKEDLKHFRIWHQLYTACCRRLPELSTFSAMKPLEYMNPQRLFPMLQLHLVAVERGVSYPSVLIPFALSAVGFVCFGFAAFVVKFAHLVSALQEIVDTQPWSMSVSCYELTLLAGFINQVFGITEVGEVETQRIFLFIFGGEGVSMQANQLDKQEVFLASVFHNVGTKLFVDEPPAVRRFKRAVAMLSFDHLAIQSLVLDEDQSLQAVARML